MDKSVIEQIGADNPARQHHALAARVRHRGGSYKAFAAAFEAAGNSPDAPFVAHGYDIAFLAALAIEKAGSADRGMISAALRDVANAPGMVIRPGEWGEGQGSHRGRRGHQLRGRLRRHRVRRERRRGRHLLPQRSWGRRHLDPGDVGRRPAGPDLNQEAESVEFGRGRPVNRCARARWNPLGEAGNGAALLLPASPRCCGSPVTPLPELSCRICPNPAWLCSRMALCVSLF